MIPLPSQFKKGAFTFNILKREGRVALLAKHKGNHFRGYEVVKIEQRPAEQIRGRQFPAREVMPRSEVWGQHGLTFTHAQCKDPLADAEMRFRQTARKHPMRPQGITPDAFSSINGRHVQEAA